MKIDNLILPVGRVVAEHAADEGEKPFELARSLASDGFSGYVMMRDDARTRRGLILLVRGKEAGTLLQVGRESLSGKKAGERIVSDHPVVSYALTAHALNEKLVLAASSPFVGFRAFQRLPAGAVVLKVILQFWKERELTGVLWVGSKEEGVSVYFYGGEVLGEIELGSSKLTSGVSRISQMWERDGTKVEAFISIDLDMEPY